MGMLAAGMPMSYVPMRVIVCGYIDQHGIVAVFVSLGTVVILAREVRMGCSCQVDP
jgi:hypothetical protein